MTISETRGRQLTGALALLLMISAAEGTASAQSIPTVLTDRIFQGSGTINLLTDISATDLATYLDANGRLMLAVDVNEAASGNESASSQGIAIQQMVLLITTTQGTFSFQDFYTSTSASLLASGSKVAAQYYTAFGTGGNTITNGTTNFDVANFDDVIYIDNVSTRGTILGATLTVSFVNTANNGSNTAEAFFDYSNGPEDFALLSPTLANSIEAANNGVAAAPSTLSYTTTAIAPVSTSAPSGSPTSGAPAPPLLVLAAMGGFALWKARAL